MIAMFVQKVLWILCKPIFHLCFNYSIVGQQNLVQVKQPLIIVANHKSILDPLLLGAAIPFHSQLWPLRFMVATGKFKTPLLNIFYSLGFLKLFYALSGCFPALRKTELNISLARPLEILQKEQGTIIMFIEGEKVLSEELGQGRRGAAALALMSGAQILPVAIQGSLGLRPYNFFGREISIIRGEPFVLPKLSLENDEHYTLETSYIMEKIRDLYKINR